MEVLRSGKLFSGFNLHHFGRTDPCISILCGLSDLANPGGHIFHTVGCHIQGLNRLRRQLLGLDCEHVGTRILPVLMHHWTDAIHGRRDDGRKRKGQREFDVRRQFLRIDN